MKTLITIFTAGLLSSFFIVKQNDTTNLNNRIDKFIDAYSSYYIVNDNDDRFTYRLEKKTNYNWSKKILLRKKTPFKNHYDQTVYQRLYIFAYKYDNSKKCQAAVDSLLNCFPNDCWKVTKGNNLKGIKITPSIFVFNENEIIACRIHCEHENEDWNKIKADFKNIFGTSTSDIITTGCGGPLEWNKE